jgi:putative acetyltransferase
MTSCNAERIAEARGLGTGGQIARRLIQEDVRLGYSTMLLDTLDRLESAIHLYESLGFVRTEPYYDNPLPGVIYWKLDIGGQHCAAAYLGVR